MHLGYFGAVRQEFDVERISSPVSGPYKITYRRTVTAEAPPTRGGGGYFGGSSWVCMGSAAFVASQGTYHLIAPYLARLADKGPAQAGNTSD